MGDLNHLSYAKKSKTGRKKLIFHLELFQQAQSVNCYIYIMCRLKNPGKHWKGRLLTYWCTSLGVKHRLFISKYRIKVVRLK